MKVSTHSIFNKSANTAAITNDYVQENVLRKLNKLDADLSTLMNFRNDGSNNNESARDNLKTLTDNINRIVATELDNVKDIDTNNSPSFG